MSRSWRRRLAVRLAAEDIYDGKLSDIAEAVDQVRLLGDPMATAEALSLYHHTLLCPSRAVERLAVADELVDVTTRGEAAPYALLGLCWRTVDLYLLGRHDAERAFLDLHDAWGPSETSRWVTSVAVLDVMRTFRRGELGAPKQWRIRRRPWARRRGTPMR